MTTPTPKTIVLITGANTGVGYHTALNLLLSSPKYHVLLGSRSSAKGIAAIETIQQQPILGTVSLLLLDISSSTSISTAVSHIAEAYGYLSILVNNAGIFPGKTSLVEAMAEAFSVNVVGTVALTEACIPLLRKGVEKRLVFVGSSTGSMTHASTPETKFNSGGGMPYRSSKAALNMVTVLYWNRLKVENDMGEGAWKVHGADPGLTVTSLMGASEEKKKALRDRGGVEGDEAGERIASVVRGDRDADVGGLCGAYGVCPW